MQVGTSSESSGQVCISKVAGAKSVKSHPATLLWQTWRSLAAKAVMASPFQSLRVWCYLPAAMWGDMGKHVQS